MRSWRIVRMRLRSLFQREAIGSEARKEMGMHLDLLTQERIAEGMPPKEARQAALRGMGNLSLLADESRDVRRVRYLHDLWDDLGYAWRLLRKSPMFTVVAVLSLGLGIGANTAIFTLIKQSYLDMLPVRNPEQIVRITRSTIDRPDLRSFSYPLYREMAEADTPFEGLIATACGRVSLVREGGESEAVSAQLVSGNYYQLLGVQPFMGRLLTPEDDLHPGAHPVIVLSYNYWRRHFASGPDIVGKTVRINTTPMTVIGVSPPGFDGLSQGWSSDVIVPMMMQPQVYQSESMLEHRGNYWMHIAGRLKPGATAAQAEGSLQPVIQAYFTEREQQPGVPDYARSSYRSSRAHVSPMATGWRRDPVAAARSMALLGITGLVLLAACANLANLLLARAAARRNEMSVRLALGAGRPRLLRQLFTESLLLAGMGGLLGLVLAVLSGPLIVRLAVGDDPQVTQSGLPDLTVLLFCLATAMLCGLLFGMAPAWQAAREEPGSGLGASRTVAGTRLLGRKILLSGQIALTLLLLVGASLFVRTLHNMQTADLGFSPEHLVQLTLLSKNAGYTDDQMLSYFDRTLESIRETPGIRSVSVAAMPVMSNSSWGSGIRIEGITIPENDQGPNRDAVGADYFSTMGIPMTLGREFDARDGEKSPKVAIVNEAFVRHYFGGENPVGRRIDEGGRREEAPRFTVVGVAKDGKYGGIRDETKPFWYIPLSQSGMRNFLTIYARTAGDPERAIADVRRAVTSVDANVATLNLRTVESQIATQQRFERMIALLVAFFGGLAVLLVAIGLYGVLSYLVNQRQREIGIRVAVGATPSRIVRLVVSGIAGWAIAGILLALPAIYYGSNAVRGILYEVQPTDPAALFWAAAILAAGVSLAAWLPARRATCIQPSTALRAE